MATNGDDIHISMESKNEENAELKIRNDEGVKRFLDSLKSRQVVPPIFRVPKPLLIENEKAYVPQIMFLGPYHFLEPGFIYDEMEALKSEVACKVHQQMGDFTKIVDKIRQEETAITNYYGKQVRWNGQMSGWMMARDVCLVLEVLNNLSDENYSEKHNKDWPVIDRILNRERHNPLLNDIVKDMLKMENQIPFFLLRQIFFMVHHKKTMYDFKQLLIRSCAYLTPFQGAIPTSSQWMSHVNDFRNMKHILGLLHTYILCEHLSPQEDTSSETAVNNTSTDTHLEDRSPPRDTSSETAADNTSTEEDWMDKICNVFLWLCLCFVCLALVVPLLCYVLWLILNQWLYHRSSNKMKVSCVAELKHAGVKFKKCKGGISEIKFDDMNRTLHLPQFKVDDRCEVLIRNLMALEIYSEAKEKKITRYVLLMNELIDTELDVGILRTNGIISNLLGSDAEVAKLWNSIKKPTENLRYDPIDDALEEIRNYCKQPLRILWAQFQEIHCSKPWVAVSVVAAILLLLLTVVQVLCLFRRCGPK